MKFCRSNPSFCCWKIPWRVVATHLTKKCWPWYTHQFEIADYCRLVDSGCKRCRVVIWVNYNDLTVTEPWNHGEYIRNSSPPWHPRELSRRVLYWFRGDPPVMWINLPGWFSQLQGLTAAPLLPSHCHSGKVCWHCMCTVITVGRQDWSPDRAFRNRVYLLKLWGDTLLPVTVTCREWWTLKWMILWSSGSMIWFLVGGVEHVFIFPYIGSFIIPTDELHHFSEG